MIPRRAAGLCLHVSSLAGPHGVGNLGAGARELIDWMAEAGFSVWQFLPLGPTGHGNSPYQLLSAFAGNPLLIDPDGLVDLGLLDSAESHAARRPASAHVDYADLIATQVSLLRLAAGRFAASEETDLHVEYEAFRARHDARWLTDFVIYSTLKRFHGHAPWIEWPEAYRDRHPAELRDWVNARSEEIAAERFVQFIWSKQWSEIRDYATQRGVQLFGDVPIYLPHDCADAWARRELLDLDSHGRPVEVAGVPPDYFSDEGQRWGNPLYAWDRHADDGYRWWVARLGHAFDCMDMVRLDHFRGFEAYWAIPADKPAREGYWHTGPGAALFEAIRHSLGDCAIIAEDLGIITEPVTALRKAFGMPGMQVLQFLVGEEGFDPSAIEEDCVCYTGTHDNDTVVGWFHHSARRDPGELRALQQVVCHQLGSGPAHIAHAMIDVAFRTRARIAIVPAQDVIGLGSEARMNTPGSVGDNWSWRLLPGQLDGGSASQMRAMIAASGRITTDGTRDGQ